MLNISEIKFDNLEIDEVVKVLKSGNVVQGKNVEVFERDFAKYIGIRYAVAVSSGTSALYLALLALGIGPGDEVITTPFSFIASSNSVLYTGAHPVFVDIDKNSLNIDVSKIEEKINKKTKAILPVHLFGLPCDMDSIMKLARKYNLKVVEDACQAHGAEYKKKKVGSVGEIGCFSFYATKNMTTIEGGMITTNSKKLTEKLKLLRSHGSKKRYYHDILGYNFRMTEINAVLGISQLKKLDVNNYKRTRNASYLNSGLNENKNFTIHKINDKSKKNVYHQYTLIAKNPSARVSLQARLEKKGINSFVYYPIPIHKQKAYKDLGYRDHLPVSEKVAKLVLSIPIHPFLTNKDLNKIIETLNN